MRRSSIVVAACALALPGPARAQATDPELDRVLAEQEAADLADEVRRLRARVEALESRPASPTALNPRITVFGDFLGTHTPSGRLGESARGSEPGRTAAGDPVLVPTTSTPNDSRFNLREVEVDLRTAIDPYADGVLILTTESESPGEFETSFEEGYATLHRLPAGLVGKVGRFRTEFGTTNRLHTHDLPHPTRPSPLVDFLGAEGDIQHGVSAAWLAPGTPLEVVLQGLDGENEAVLAGPAARRLAGLGRVRWSTPVGLAGYAALGASTLAGSRDPRGDETATLTGTDLLLQWRPSTWRSAAALVETWYLDSERASGPDPHPFGWSAWLQVQPALRWFAGVRYDESEFTGGVDHDERWTGGAYASWYTTEFLRVRAGWEHTETDFGSGAQGEDTDALYGQLTFVFGSHPAEPFWVNR
ncbi:MAG: hypothetical protein HY722_09820 [Planctomycetes bacterium]|nr:hypothetical protein [Planctomycetota bacterium]